MSDGNDDIRVDEETSDVPAQDPPASVEDPAPPVVDSWATAFEALEEKGVEDPGSDEPDASGSQPPDAGTGKSADEADAPAAVSGGSAVPDDGVDASDDGGDVPGAGPGGAADVGVEVPDVEATLEQYQQDIEQRALRETAQAFLDRADDKGRKLIRQRDGIMGANIDDPDIYRVDPETGVPTFYDPDTGRPFTGDNPRAQAKAWVDAYNDELRSTFNRIAEVRQQEIEAEMAPVLNMIKFTPTFEALDPVRQKMLEVLIEDYEVYDSDGKHIGYSVDLDQALAQVNKQVKAIQAQQQKKQDAPPATPKPTEDPKKPTGPALDMPTSGGDQPSSKPPASLAEAMEAAQDAQLSKLRKK